MEAYHHHPSWMLVILTLIISAASESGHSSLSSSSSLSSGSSMSSATAEARGENCHLPSEWEGSWFQSGVHHSITINRSTISTKGKCLEADGEKFLFHNERDNCYRCLVFHQKHNNVLQYKETFCVPERRFLRHICSTITGDANLFAMFRLDAVPIECPFKGPFTFTYNRGHGECRYPISTIDSCIHSSRLAFNYQACPDVAGTESAVEELQCLAMWKEGSSRYLLGLIQYQHHASYEERFRCFVYERNKKGEGNSGRSHGHFPSNNSDLIFRVAQSGDATCNGLSAMEGSRTMTLRRAHPPKPCQFPSWLQLHTQWHTLDQQSTFVFETTSLRVSNSSDLAGSGPNTLTMTAVCSQILENPTLDKVMLVLHSTTGCRTGYVCSAFYRRDGHIVEIQIGNIARRAEDACHLSYFDQSRLPYVTLVSSTPETRQCPNWGRFTVTGLAKEGRKINEKCIEGFNTLSVGCSSLDTFQFRSECSSTDLVAEFYCHGWWEEQGISYLIATPSTQSSLASGAKRSCFVFREKTTEPTTLQKSPQRLKQLGIPFDEESLLNSNGQEDFISNNGRILEFSSTADSCRRNLAPGVEGALAFNVTSNGQCFDTDSASIISSTKTWRVTIVFSMGISFLHYKASLAMTHFIS